MGVTGLRHILALHRWAAAWLVAFALAVRLVVPAGFMPMAGHAALEICAGQTMGLSAAAPMAAMPAMAAMPGMEGVHAIHAAAPMAAMPAMAAMPGMEGVHAIHAAAPTHDMDHGGKPMSGASDHDCGFASAVGGAASLPSLILPALLAPVALPVAFVRTLAMRPGLGLAAPPPPKTGPPILLR